MTYVIEADFDLMAASREQLIEALRGLQFVSEDFRGQVELLLATWEGDAADAYRIAQNDWMNANDLSSSDLLAMLQTLTAVLARYQQVEAKIIALTG